LEISINLKLVGVVNNGGVIMVVSAAKDAANALKDGFSFFLIGIFKK